MPFQLVYISVTKFSHHAGDGLVKGRNVMLNINVLINPVVPTETFQLLAIIYSVFYLPLKFVIYI
jgi:hypothetical protein